MKLPENDLEQQYQKVQKLLVPSEKQLRTATAPQHKPLVVMKINLG